jgi:hypothetical protein
VEGAELSEKGDQRTFTKAVVDGGVEGKSWELLTEVTYPCSSYLGRNKVNLVEHENQMLVRCLGPDVFFDGAATSPIRVAGI